MEHGSAALIQSIVFLVSGVVAVLISHRLGLGAPPGYLLAGVAIGPFGLGLVDTLDEVQPLAEFGVVFLLFVIGLELEPQRLWNARFRLLSLGVSQVAGSIALFGAAAWLLGADLRVGIVAGMALALSSTAMALQPLSSRGGLQNQGGQAVFSTLLFQDIAVIPMLALLPLLGGATRDTGFSAAGLATAAFAIALTLVGGHLLARPVFRHIARTREREIFTAFAVLLVLGMAWIFESAGLSMALGTFLAGVLLAESEYRHEIEAAVEPFKGMLLGLFFIVVGMGIDVDLFASIPLVVLGLIAALFLVKGAVLWVIGRMARLPADELPLFVLLLAQGGEFAFVILTLGVQQNVLQESEAHALTLAVALSMLLTPFLLLIYDRMFRSNVERREAADDIPQNGRVIVAGLGRVGQVVARLLHASGYEPTVLDDDPDHVEQCRRFGFRVFYGDATRLDLLHAAGAAQAKFLIIALDDPVAISSLARTAVKHFPSLRVLARARDMRHVFELRDIGIEAIERDTFRSSLELGRLTLAAVTGDPERARRAVNNFEQHDGEVLNKLYAAHRHSPDSQVALSNELRDEFIRIIQEDEALAGQRDRRPSGGDA